MNMLELHNLTVLQTFKDIVTIDELISLSTPPLNVNTVYNAINKGKLIACKKGGQLDKRGGVWLIHLPSARNLWRKRFVSSEYVNNG